MIDVLDFISSDSIKRHIFEVGHEFTPRELVSIVYRSYNHTFEEKLCAFSKIVENYPNSDIVGALGKYVKSRQSLIEKLCMTEENTVYSYQSYFDGETEVGDIKEYYSSLEKVRLTAMDDIEFEPKFFEVEKIYIDTNDKIYARYNTKFELISICESSFFGDYSECEDVIWNLQFDSKIPHPFCVGDVIEGEIGKYQKSGYRYNLFEIAECDEGALRGYPLSCERKREGELEYIDYLGFEKKD